MTWPRRLVTGGEITLPPGTGEMVLLPAQAATGALPTLPERWRTDAVLPHRLALIGFDPGTDGSAPRLDTAGAVALRDEAVAGRTIPLVAQALRSGALELPAPVQRSIDALDRQAQEVSVRIESAALDALDVLDASGIRAIVLKGLATSHLDYPSPHLRQIGDVDLLVPPGAFDRTEGVLAAAGYKPVGRAGRDEATRSTTLRSPTRVEIDVHRLPTWLPYGAWALGAHPVPVTSVAPHGWTALGEADRAVHAIAHYVLSHGMYRRLSSAGDALALWPQSGPAEPWAPAIDRWHAATLVTVFHRMMRANFGIQLPELPGCPPRPARWFEQSVTSGAGADAVLARYGRLTALPARRWPAEVWRLVFPSPELRRAAGLGSWSAHSMHRASSILARCPNRQREARARFGSPEADGERAGDRPEGSVAPELFP